MAMLTLIQAGKVDPCIFYAKGGDTMAGKKKTTAKAKKTGMKPGKMC